MTLADRIADARSALLAAAQPVEALDRAWGGPWRVVVLGGQGVGKTTLVNRLSGTDGATGLGGVTTAVREVQLPGVTLVDLPATDHPAWPGDLAAAADAAIWLVDGLQPLPMSEVDAVRRVGCPETLHVGVTRLDLVEPDQAPDVLGRVRARLAPFRPVAVRPLDPRGDPPPFPLLVRAGAGLARQRALLEAACRAADALPALDLSLVQRWQGLARDARGGEPLERAARAALHALGTDLPLPGPPSEPSTPIRKLLGGESAHQREHRVRFAQWAIAVELALRDAAAERHAAAARAAVALDALIRPLRDRCVE